VTDLRNFGFFVDVTGLAMSGLVPLSTMEDDFYIYDEQRNQLIGRRTRRIIRLGDKLEVQVAKVDTAKKQVDFRLATKTSDAQKPSFKMLQRPKQYQLPVSSSSRREGTRNNRSRRR
jgi:ribonuclease R